MTQPVGGYRTAISGAARETKFSTDGTKLFVALGTQVTVFSTANGAQIAQYSFGQTVSAIDLSVDGNSLAVALSTGTNASHAMVSIVALQTGVITAFDLAVGGAIAAGFADVAFQSNGRLLLSQASTSNSTGSLVDFDPATGTATAIAGPAWGSNLIANGNHSQIFILEPTILGRTRVFTSDVGLTAVRTLYPDPYSGASVPYPQSTVGAVSSDQTTFLQAEHLLSSSNSLAPAAAHYFPWSGTERGMIFSPSGDRLYVLMGANVIIAYDPATWQPVATYNTGATFAIGSRTYGDLLQISPDGHYLSVTGMNDVVMIDLTLALPASTNGSDTLSGPGWQIGLGGNDTLDSTSYTQFEGGTGYGRMFGGTGDDTYVIDGYSDEVVELAGEGYDSILLSNLSYYSVPNFVERVTILTATGAGVYAGLDDNRIDGGPGPDSIGASGGNDVVFGNDGADTINGGAGNDTIDGGGAGDTLAGDAGADSLVGGNGNDSIYSASYSPYSSNHDSWGEVDTIAAGDGDDLVWIGYGDSADGGSGTDTLALSLFAAPVGVTFTIAGLLGPNPYLLGGGTIVNFEALSHLLGTDFADTLDLTGAATALTIDGGGGDDRIFSGNGADTIDGDAGFNTLDYSLFASGVTAGFTSYGSGTGPVGDSFRNIQVLAGSGFADTLTSSYAGDRLDGNGGADLLIGGYGIDTLNGGDGDDTLYAHLQSGAFMAPTYGSPGVAPTLDTYSDRDTLNGGAGNDVIFSGTGDTVDGGDGTDTLYVSFANYVSGYFGVNVDFRQPTVDYAGATISGIEHVGWLQGSYYGDTIRLDDAIGVLAAAFGSFGNDQLYAGLFTGSLSGEQDNDTLDGTGSQNLIFLDGGSGNDRLVVGSNNVGAAMIGGSGTDTLAIASSISSLLAVSGIEAVELTAGSNLILTPAQAMTGLALNTAFSGSGTVTINMDAGVLLSITGFQGAAAAPGISFTINGTAGVDAIKAAHFLNTINGGAGTDQIRGGNGVDTIDGGTERDKLAGWGGADVLTGGGGNDQFRYLFATDSGTGAAADRITDFTIGSDVIDLRLLDSDLGTAGVQNYAFSFIGGAAFTNGGSAQVRYADSGADLLVQMDLDGNGVADMEIVLQGLAGQTLTAAQFVLGTPPAMEPPAAKGIGSGGEVATQMSGPNPAQTSIQFGDSARGITASYTIVNTAGIAQPTIDLLTGLANEAFRLWGNVLAGTANISVQLTIAELANNRGNGGWGTGFTVGSSGGFSVAVGAPANELGLGTNTGGGTDIVISLDPDYIANELFLDPTPATRDDIPANRTDGLSVFIHEIGHALGFIGYYNEVNDTFSSNFKTTYDLRLSIAGGNVSFDGPNVRAVYGTAVPLTDTNYTHYGNTNANPSSSTDPLTGLMNGVVFYRGYGYAIGDLDLAFLADTGLGTIRNDILNVAQLTHMRGGPGNDTITGSGLNNSLWGDEDNDTIYGGAGNDTIDGGSGIDKLDGEGGDDALTGAAGDDTIDGGAGTNDEARYSGNRADYLVENVSIGGVSYVRITGQGAAAGDGVDLLRNVEFAQFADQRLRFGNQLPQLGALPLPDQTIGDSAPYSYQIPLGAFTDPDPGDVLAFSASLADGSPLPAWLTFNPATRTFNGTPPVAAIGTTLQVRVTASDNAPGDPGSLVSDVFALSIFQSPGADIVGTALTDFLNGTFRDERIYGLDGNDRLYGSPGADLLDGGNGTDIVDYVNSPSGVTVNLSANTGQGGDAHGDTYNAIEMVFGSTFADTLSGSTGDDIFYGDAGDDTLIGGNGADNLTGGTGMDTLDGGPGNDLLDGGEGPDQMSGGAGDDTYWLYIGSDEADVIVENAGEGFDWITTSFASYSLGANVEMLTAFGGATARTFIGNDLGNTISGIGGDDFLSGGAGNDTLHGETGNDWLDGGSGDDVLIGGFGNDTYVIDSLGDSITDVGGTDTIRTTLSTYTLGAGFENLTYTGGSGATLTGNFGSNAIIGGSGSDILNGAGGIDQLFGEAGDDRIVLGASGSGSSVDGGLGTDTLALSGAVSLGALLGLEAIELVGGPSLTLSAAQFNTGFYDAIAQIGMASVSGSGTLVFNLDSHPVAAALSLTGLSFAGGSSVTVTINGTSGIDAIKGAPGATNTISGGDDADQIRGGNQADTINGGNGNDKLFGWGGVDVLTGGTGSDQFRYFFATDSGTGAAADQITDFEIGIDRFNFTLIDADPVTPGDQAFAFLGTSAFTAAGTGQIRYQNSGADLLLQVDVDGNGTVDMEVVLQGLAGQALTSADFML